MENKAFDDHGEAGIQTISMDSIGGDKEPHSKQPAQRLPSVKDVEGPGLSSVRQRNNKSDEGDAVQPDSDGVQQEDYNIFTYLPNYYSYKKKYMQFMEDPSFLRKLRILKGVILASLFGAYFLAVLLITSSIEQDDYWCEGDGMLVIITTIAVLMMLYFLVIKKYFGNQIYKSVLMPLGARFDAVWQIRWTRYSTYAVLVISLGVFLVVDSAGNRQRLVSLVGLFSLLFFGFLFSYAPRKIVWRHVMWGMGLQFLLGLLILRWSVGRAVFACAGKKVEHFLAFTDVGSKFVFGRLVSQYAIFGFQVLPVVLFFSFFVQILFYYGIMQWVVIKMGWILQVTVGTTTCESMNAAANIFLGQTEAPLIIKPYLSLMTRSELHAVMTGGFATIAGSVMAAYIIMGVSSSHLLTASVMSAPAALAYAKLFYPETEETRTQVDQMPEVKCTEVNVLHAATEGVVMAIPLVLNIAANLIVFIAFIAFFDAIFNWSCQLVNIEDGFCSFENIFGYVFMPLAWSMGVSWGECHLVGTLIALKTIVNEFVAYAALADMIRDGKLSPRAQIIATYALCGFSNISAIGIQLGGIGAMAPSRRGDIARVVVRAMIAGSAACFLTGCVAGTLLDDASLGQAGTELTTTTTAASVLA